MKLIVLTGMLMFPMILGGRACGGDGTEHQVIVQADDEEKAGGWLGVSVQDMTPRLAKKLEVKTTEGAYVVDVVEESPAEDAGIKRKDIIVEVSGKGIGDAEDITRIVRGIKPGTTVTVIVVRKDERKTLSATLDKRPQGRAYAYSFPPSSKPKRVLLDIFRGPAILGMELTKLTEQLGRYFEAPDGRGVLVSEVEEGSRAGKAGFKAGDVIIAVGKEKVHDIGDVIDAMRNYKEGEKADIEIVRKGSRKTVQVEVPEMKGWHGIHIAPAPDLNLLEEFREDGDPLHLEGLERGARHDLDRLRIHLRDVGRQIRLEARKLGDELRLRFSCETI